MPRCDYERYEGYQDLEKALYPIYTQIDEDEFEIVGYEIR